MPILRLGLIVALAAAASASARGGVCLPDGTAPPHAAPLIPSASDLRAGDLSWLLSSPAPLHPLVDEAPPIAEPDALTIRVPTPPSSLALSLSAVIGLGLLRAGRALREGALAAAPDWYHTGGPRQVGYATPIDPTGTFGQVALPVPLILVPALAQDPRTARYEPPPLACPHPATRPAAPRGPPVC